MDFVMSPVYYKRCDEHDQEAGMPRSRTVPAAGRRRLRALVLHPQS